MTQPTAKTPYIAVACGGTGGHLFPGLAVAEQLIKRGCAVSLLISPKEVDQQAVKSVTGMEIVTLPAVAFQNRNFISFARGCFRSYCAARRCFKSRRPHAVLAMGGFTSAPAILAAKWLGARTFLHESNTIPGRANRWLARFVDQAFVGFPQAAERLHAGDIAVTGTPVRSEFQPRDPAPCRAALGLDANRPVVLVMGGSQGASGINEMILSALPIIAKRVPHWQWLHLTGPTDTERVRQAYAALGIKAVVRPFLTEMDLALGAASAAISRAGASSLAEIAAMRLPSLLVPYPHAADNHQYYNALAFEETGAAQLFYQKSAPPKPVADLMQKMLVGMLVGLVEDTSSREIKQAALAKWHAPKAAEQIVEIVLKTVGEYASKSTQHQAPSTRETPSSNNQTAIRAAGLGAWTLVLLWCLVLGSWSF